MTSLRKARDEGKLDQFAADHETDPPGDKALFNATFFATGGWSGAELLISAMRRHWQIWKHVQSWERGGLYVVDAKSRAMG